MVINSSRRLAAICTAGIFGLMSSASAEVSRDLSSHEHGSSRLDLVVEGSTLYVQFESPWVNLIGFEHKPTTEQQRTLFSAAIARLAQSAELFVVNADAGCSAQPARVESTISAGDDEQHSDEEHSDEEHSDETHSDEEHSDEEHSDETHSDEEHSDEEHSDVAHSDEAHAEEQHSEVRVHHEFECESPSELEQVNVMLFEVWPDVDEIDVQMAGPGGQAAVELTSADAVVDLSGIR